MTDPYVWYPNANMTGVFVDGGHGTPHIYHTYGSVMGNINPLLMEFSHGFMDVPTGFPCHPVADDTDDTHHRG